MKLSRRLRPSMISTFISLMMFSPAELDGDVWSQEAGTSPKPVRSDHFTMVGQFVAPLVTFRAIRKSWSALSAAPRPPAYRFGSAERWSTGVVGIGREGKG